jgi:hypothetical protein
MEQDPMDLLTQGDIQLIKDAYAYITVLISGADGKIDEKELAWAEKIVQIRTFSGDERFHPIHEAITTELPGKIRSLIAELPTDTKARQSAISLELEKLNPVLAKLHPSTGAYLYKGFVSFAERVAKASGGVLSFFSIGPEEKKWIGLPMLTAIIWTDEELDEEE